MPHTPRFQTDVEQSYQSVLPDLTELCRIHDIGLDLINRSHDLDELLDLVLEEYERKLTELPPEALDSRGSSASLPTAKKLRALVMFANQAVALKVKAERYQEVEDHHRLEKLGDVLRTLGVLSHKINNPLTALIGRAQLLQGYKDADPRVVKAAKVIEESATRIAELIRELARVAKEGREEAVEQPLNMGNGDVPEKEGR